MGIPSLFLHFLREFGRRFALKLYSPIIRQSRQTEKAKSESISPTRKRAYAENIHKPPKQSAVPSASAASETRSPHKGASIQRRIRPPSSERTGRRLTAASPQEAITNVSFVPSPPRQADTSMRAIASRIAADKRLKRGPAAAITASRR